MAHETFTQQRAAIFANRGLSWDKKKQLFYTLIMSGLTYATGVFMPLNRKDMELWTKGLHKLYRRMAQTQFGLQQRHWNDRRLRAQLQVPHPQVVLRAGRLSYLQHLVRAGDDYGLGHVPTNATMVGAYIRGIWTGLETMYVDLSCRLVVFMNNGRHGNRCYKDQARAGPIW